MDLITKVTIDLIRCNHLEIVPAKQNDIGRGVEITLLANGVVFPARSSDLVRIFVKKPDRKLVYNNCTVQDGKVIAPLTSQTLATPGRALVEIELIRGESRLSNPIFELDIAPTNINDDAIQSTNEFGVIKEWMDGSVEAINEAASSANAAAKKAGISAGEAERSAAAADLSEANARASEAGASESAAIASVSAETAVQKAESARESELNAEKYKKQAQSYAVGTGGARPGEATDNSKYYYEQSKDIYNNFSSAGDVTGVKGNAESTYRAGNVNLTKENIGLGNVDNTADLDKTVGAALLARNIEGHEIVENDDLNDCTKYAMYYCTDNTRASQVVNMPDGFASAFIMEVTNYHRQGNSYWYGHQILRSIYQVSNIAARMGNWMRAFSSGDAGQTYIFQKWIQLPTELSGTAYQAKEPFMNFLIDKSDLNSLKTNGYYVAPGDVIGSSCINTPVANGGAFYLVVLELSVSRSKQYGVQIFIRHATQEVWIRQWGGSNGDVWKDWRPFYSSMSLPPRLKELVVSTTEDTIGMCGTNGIGYAKTETIGDPGFNVPAGALFQQRFSADWIYRIFGNYRTGEMATRGWNNGVAQPWRIQVDSGNFGYYGIKVTQDIPENAKLNDYVTSGFYKCPFTARAETISNLPTGPCAFALLVMTHTGGVAGATQIFARYEQSRLYVRRGYNGTWGDWTEIVSETYGVAASSKALVDAANNTKITAQYSGDAVAISNLKYICGWNEYKIVAYSLSDLVNRIFGYRHVGESMLGTESVSLGHNTSAPGFYSVAEGEGTKAQGIACHAEGYGTIANMYQHACGHYNVSTVGPSSSGGTGTGTSFIVGNGTSGTRSNAARIDANGKLWCKAAYSATGADYAELFEWEDGNPTKEDRRGCFVTLEGERIRFAKPGDYILGIISANPCVVGNTDTEWCGKFMKDEFDEFIKVPTKEIRLVPKKDEDGKAVLDDGGRPVMVEEEVIGEFYKVNPDYDPNQVYVDRISRPEWDYVGMLGVLPVRDDGTCQVNHYAVCNDDGIATASEDRINGYRVIKRVNDHIVKVVFK